MQGTGDGALNGGEDVVCVHVLAMVRFVGFGLGRVLRWGVIVVTAYILQGGELLLAVWGQSKGSKFSSRLQGHVAGQWELLL